MIKGIHYHFRGLKLTLGTPRLLFLGIVRFGAVILLTVALAGLILVYHEKVLGLIWTRPEAGWFLWAWIFFSWLAAAALIGLSGIFSYLLSQVLFSVFIMDQMSRITELKVTGRIREPSNVSIFGLFVHLVRQEIPRSILPVIASVVLMVLGWALPLGPLFAVASSGAAIVFLAWDNTDLLPARRMVPFGQRFRLLMKTLPFHVGFGLPFLVPGLNLLFLSFAPVGATLYFVERYDSASPMK